jgi:hypothetical protein
VPYWSSVIVADLWPSICCTTFTFAPDAIASEAAVCLSSCGCSPGRPIAWAAASKPHGGTQPHAERSQPAPQGTRGHPRPYPRRAPQARQRRTAGSAPLAARGPWEFPHLAAALHHCHRLRDVGAPTHQVKAAHAQRRQLAPPQAVYARTSTISR